MLRLQKLFLRRIRIEVFVVGMLLLATNLPAQPRMWPFQLASMAADQPVADIYASAATDIMRNPVLGNLKVLIIRPRYQGEHSGLVTDAQAIQVGADIKFALETNSYGNVTVQYEITPVLDMPRTGSYYMQFTDSLVRIRADALQAAEDAGFNLSDYDIYVIESKKYWVGQAGFSIGTKTVIESLGSGFHSAHEIGHTFDWNHANWWVEYDNSSPNLVVGTEKEYYDGFDIMGDLLGRTRTFHHFNPWFKYRAGWLPEENILTVTSSGTYTVQAIENTPDSGTPVQAYTALRIRRNKSEDYWVFYRRDEASVSNGAIITQGYNSNLMPSRLYDTTPLSRTEDWSDAALAVGKTFNDPGSGISIKTVSKTTNTLQMQVTLPPGGQPSHVPAIDIISPAKDKVLQDLVTYEMTAFDPDIGNNNGDGIQKVEFFLYIFREGLVQAVRNGKNAPFAADVYAQFTSPPYSLVVNTNALDNRGYWATVRAISTQGDSVMVWRHFILDNAGPTLIPPLAPSLAAPDNNASDVDVNPTLAWHPAKRATSYRMQVATDPGFNSIVIDRSGITDTSAVAAGLAHSTIYYWRVNASNAAGTSGGSGTRLFTTVIAPPAAPVLVSPADMATDIAVDTLLVWNPAPTAASYNVQVATTSNFSTLVIDTTGLASTQIEVGNLLQATMYYWRVGAVNTGGTGPWSSARSFMTVPSLPPAPSLVSPPDGATDVGLDVALSWNAVPSATTYDLQVAADSNFTSLTVDEKNLTTTAFQPAGLDNGTRYFWRVRAANSSGAGDWSEAWAYDTIFLPPAAPLLSSPANEAVEVATSPTLAWNPVAGADSYDVQVAAVIDFSVLLVDATGTPDTSYHVNGLVNGSGYYWRVKAVNAGGQSPWSSVWHFQTITGVPLAPLLAAPADGAIGVAPDVDLEWNLVAGADSYHLQISTSQNFDIVLLDDNTINDTHRRTDLQADKTYFWRVSALNAAGQGAWSAVWSFATQLAIPVAPMLVAPADSSDGVATDVTFAWQPTTDADTYTLQISTDQQFTSTVVNEGGLTDPGFSFDGLAYATQYFWRVSATNTTGTGPWSVVWRFTTEISTGIDDEHVPDTFVLNQNYPNPFNPGTTISFALPAPAFVTMKVHNILGDEIRVLLNEQMTAGEHQVHFDAGRLPAGVYFVTLRAGGHMATRKMIFSK